MSSDNIVNDSSNVLAYLDGNPVTCLVAMDQPFSYVQQPIAAAREGVGYCQLRTVEVPNLPSPLQKQVGMMLVPSSTIEQGVVLGRDWYSLCSAVSPSVAPRGGSSMLAHIEDVLDRTKMSHECVFVAGSDELQRLGQKHGIQWTCGSTQRERRRDVIRHIMSGECVTNNVLEMDGCRNVVLQLRPGSRAEVVRAVMFCVNRLKSQVCHEDLQEICRALNMAFVARGSLDACLQGLREFVDLWTSREMKDKIFDRDLDTVPLPELKEIAYCHGLDFVSSNVEQLREGILKHIACGGCWRSQNEVNSDSNHLPGHACAQIQESSLKHSFQSTDSSFDAAFTQLRIRVLEHALKKFSVRALKRVLSVLDINLPSDKRVRHQLKKYITSLQKGKLPEATLRHTTPLVEDRSSANGTVPGTPNDRIWPKLVPEHLKRKIVRLFKSETGRSTLLEAICAVCGERGTASENFKTVDADKLNLTPLTYQPMYRDDSSANGIATRESALKEALCPINQGILKDLILERKGIHREEGRYRLDTCSGCYRQLSKGKMPALSAANGLAVGPVPPELSGLTPVEEMLIAKSRAKCCIVQLREEDVVLPNLQRGIKGNVIIFPQQPERIDSVLPPAMSDLTTYICVVFVGSSRPSDEWIRSKALPLVVRREKIRAALGWLKEHNKLYADVEISDDRIDELPENGSPPFHVQCEISSGGEKNATSSYIPSVSGVSAIYPLPLDKPRETTFENVVVANIDSSASMNALRSAALQHLKTPRKGFIEVPHGPAPVNEFSNPNLFPELYPTLFPYGVGGIEDPKRRPLVSMQRHVTHLLRLDDARFQQHHSFIFTAFNILQRRQALLHTKLKVDSPSFPRIAEEIASLSPVAVRNVTGRVAEGDLVTAYTDEERRVLKLMQEVKTVTHHVSGSSAARLAMRNEIRGLSPAKVSRAFS